MKPLLLFATLILHGLGVAEERVTIRYACSDNTETIAVTKGVVAEFEKAHPGIRVKIEPIVSEYAQKLMTMVAGRVAPDVARMGPNDFQPLAARGGLVCCPAATGSLARMPMMPHISCYLRAIAPGSLWLVSAYRPAARARRYEGDR